MVSVKIMGRPTRKKLCSEGHRCPSGRRLAISQQCAFVAKEPSCILGCIKKNLASRLREVILPLYSTLGRSQLDYCVQFCAPRFERDRDLLEGVQQRATKMIKGLEHLHEERQSTFQRQFSLGKRKQRGNLINVYKYLKGGERQMSEARLFLVVCFHRTRSLNI